MDGAEVTFSGETQHTITNNNFQVAIPNGIKVCDKSYTGIWALQYRAESIPFDRVIFKLQAAKSYTTTFVDVISYEGRKEITSANKVEETLNAVLENVPITANTALATVFDVQNTGVYDITSYLKVLHMNEMWIFYNKSRDITFQYET